MRESKASTVKFWIVAMLALALGGLGLATLVPAAHNAARTQSASLTSAGQQASDGGAVGEAEADFHLATLLNPSNTAAWIGLAQTQIAAGQPSLAVDTLKHAGQGSDVARLQVRTLIELNRPADAAAAAANLTGASATQADLTLAGLTYALAGRTPDAAALLPRLNSPQAATSVSRAQADKLPLAVELYATGLLNSSRAILATLPASFERNLLLARINYARHTAASLTQAASLLAAALAISPTNVEARQLLQSVYADQNNPTGASQQAGLISQLQAGRP